MYSTSFSMQCLRQLQSDIVVFGMEFKQFITDLCYYCAKFLQKISSTNLCGPENLFCISRIWGGKNPFSWPFVKVPTPSCVRNCFCLFLGAAASQTSACWSEQLWWSDIPCSCGSHLARAGHPQAQVPEERIRMLREPYYGIPISYRFESEFLCQWFSWVSCDQTLTKALTLSSA